jgi:hypothetical protein
MYIVEEFFIPGLLMYENLEALVIKLRASYQARGEKFDSEVFEALTASLNAEDRDRLTVLAFGDNESFNDPPPEAPSQPKRLSGDVHVSHDAHVYGPTVGVNLGHIMYGRASDEDEQRRLRASMNIAATRRKVADFAFL